MSVVQQNVAVGARHARQFGEIYRDGKRIAFGGGRLFRVERNFLARGKDERLARQLPDADFGAL